MAGKCLNFVGDVTVPLSLLVVGSLLAGMPVGRIFGSVRLWVLAANEPARRFYEHMGMIPSGRTKTEAIGGEMLPLTEYFLFLHILSFS